MEVLERTGIIGIHAMLRQLSVSSDICKPTKDTATTCIVATAINLKTTMATTSTSGENSPVTPPPPPPSIPIITTTTSAATATTLPTLTTCVTILDVQPGTSVTTSAATTSNADSVPTCPNCDRTSLTDLIVNLRIRAIETDEPIPGAPSCILLTRQNCPHCPGTFTHRMGQFGPISIHDNGVYRNVDISANSPSAIVAATSSIAITTKSTIPNLPFLGCHCSRTSRIGLSKHPASVMVFGLIASDGKVMLPVFIKAGVRVNTDVYLNVHQKHVMPSIDSIYTLDGDVVFQQDVAAAPLRSRKAQKRLEDHMPYFWHKDMWPPSSNKPHDSIEALKVSSAREWNKMSPEYIRNTCTTFRTRIEEVIANNGSPIE
nr:unnamed protein product [Spirometra erinaceieuropaei]